VANYTFSSDLLEDVLFRAGEPTDGTSDFDTTALRYLNRAYQIIWTGGGEFDESLNEEWWWLRKRPPGVLTLQPKITAGTVQVTNGSASITFTAAPDPALDASTASGWFFKVDAHPDVFRILTHTSGNTAATLGSVYTGPTATAARYTLVKLEYPLATDVLRIFSPMRVQQGGRAEIEGRDVNALDRDYPLTHLQGGVPRAFAPVGERTVRMSHSGGASGTALIRAEYDYLRRPADLTDSGSEEPLVPQPYRKVLADMATFYLFLDKNDARAEGAGRLAQGGLRAMAREQRRRQQSTARTNGQILPRPSALPHYQTPPRTESGLILG
jgi:hypothetical protein